MDVIDENEQTKDDTKDETNEKEEKSVDIEPLQVRRSVLFVTGVCIFLLSLLENDQ